MKALHHALAVGVTAAVLFAAPARAQVFNPETFTLKNGMQVIVVPNHRVPVVSHMVWYKVGAADEVAGKTGLAHMVEHMMFKGTKTVPAGEFSHIVAQNGGRDNAFTSADYTAFYQNVAVDRLDLVMKLESDRMANLKLDDKDFQPERQVVLEERRMRIENDPQALLSEQLEASLYLNSPYHHPVIGWRNEIERYKVEDIVAFHQRWYAPNNAVLVVSGDITAAQLKPLAEKYYGVIPPRPVPVRARTEEPPPVVARTVELRDPDVHQPSWERLYLAPSYHKGDSQYAYPLQVLSEVIGGGATGRLYKGLVVDQKVASYASSSYDPAAVDLTSFSISASPSPGVEVAKLQESLVALIQSVATTGVTDEEVRRAKDRLQANVAYAKDSLHTGARVLGGAIASGQTVDDVEAWPRRIAAVTAEQVNAAARAVLKDEGSVTGLLLPGPGGTDENGEPRPSRAGSSMGRDLR